MLSKAEIVDVIMERLHEAECQCNSAWLHHNDGVIRGLLWAMTGKDHGTNLLARPIDILKAVGAIVKEADGQLHYELPDLPPVVLDGLDYITSSPSDQTIADIATASARISMRACEIVVEEQLRDN